MLTRNEELRLIRLLAKADTPTDIVARALKVRRCDFTLYHTSPETPGWTTIEVRGNIIPIQESTPLGGLLQ